MKKRKYSVPKITDLHIAGTCGCACQCGILSGGGAGAM